MARREATNSESESNTGSNTHHSTNSRASTKARHQAMLQQQKEFLAKYIHSNGPDDLPKSDPMDFNNWSEEDLRRYRDTFLTSPGVAAPDIKTFQGYLVESELGQHSESYIQNELTKTKVENNQASISDVRTRNDLRKLVEEHFNNTLVAKESETITNFMYKVKNEDKIFRMYFDKKN
ncbi:unnamed protein product [[Candida] boidinii]|nr:unnamed protein product [[Candida] boidinii]